MQKHCRNGIDMKTEFLKELKEKSKLTTKQISDISGIPESTISRILSGQTDNPTFDTVSALVKAMGGSLDELAEFKTKSDDAEESSLVELYEKVIAEKNGYIKALIAICCALAAVLALGTILDAIDGAIGHLRY